jgi:hypothetical protein
VGLARLAARLSARDPSLRALRDQAMRLLASPALLEARPFSPTVLLVP